MYSQFDQKVGLHVIEEKEYPRPQLNTVRSKPGKHYSFFSFTLSYQTAYKREEKNDKDTDFRPFNFQRLPRVSLLYQ
jgi:hypothetical protein